VTAPADDAPATAPKIRDDYQGGVTVCSAIDYDCLKPRVLVDSQGFLIASIDLGNAWLQLYTPAQARVLADKFCEMARRMEQLAGPAAGEGQAEEHGRV
jgi:hypothetical protein